MSANMPGRLPGSLRYFIKSYSNWLRKFVLLYSFYRWGNGYSSHASQTETTYLNTSVNTKGRKRTLCYLFWTWLCWYASKTSRIVFSFMFSKRFCSWSYYFSSSGKSLHLEKKPFFGWRSTLNSSSSLGERC